MAREKQMLGGGEIAGFCEQVAMILSSGVPLYMGMEALKSAYKGRKNEACFLQVCDHVIVNGSMTEALKAVPGWPSYMVEMVTIGEVTGRLDQVMSKLAAHYQREEELKSAVRSAMAYPLVLGVMVMGILLVMILKVLPVFRNVLASMGLSISGAGAGLMQVGTALGTVTLIVMTLIILCALVVFLLMRTKHRAQVVQLLGKLFRPLGRMYEQRSAARTASVLSMLLGGGIALEEAFRTIPAVLEDALAREKIQDMARAVAEGKGVGDAVADTGLFDDMSACLIRTGAAVGLMDSTMEKIAIDYEQRTEKSLERMSSAIEPALVGLLAIVIGGVLLSLMLPMGGIISGML